eukprot:jgi/Hompol1/2368/HPOL_005969-RA
MARNEEKSQSMLYRFREAQRIERGGTPLFDKRPNNPNFVKSLKDAERWRRELIREISRKIDHINDSGLSDFQVRDLNDEINNMMRDKRRWEYRIKELGGTDFSRRPGAVDVMGKTVPGTKGYRYFGRAKELPGVKELFQQAAIEQAKVAPEDMWHHVDGDYFGYRDEDDGLLLEYEQAQEDAAKQEIIARFGESMSENLDLESLPLPKLPTQQQVEAWIVKRRRQELAQQYLNGVEV